MVDFIRYWWGHCEICATKFIAGLGIAPSSIEEARLTLTGPGNLQLTGTARSWQTSEAKRGRYKLRTSRAYNTGPDNGKM
ncbi:MAG: hypothetical protein JRG77_09755 [Deltaproteobacteria bacterium]|nr:hypothetical protein [Deltaproteobacteria bacterium]